MSLPLDQVLVLEPDGAFRFPKKPDEIHRNSVTLLYQFHDSGKAIFADRTGWWDCEIVHRNASPLSNLQAAYEAVKP